MYLAKVWPLKRGLTGITPEGRRVSLSLGVPGFMEYAEAIEAQTRGELQLMAGQTPQSLKKPVFEDRGMAAESKQIPRSGRPRKTYSRRDIQAEKPGN